MSGINKYLWKFFKPNIYKSYVEQKYVRSLPFEEIKKIQWARLKELLDFCYNSSDFYRDWFDSANITPKDINSYEDFSKIPLTNKRILQDARSKVMAKGTCRDDYYITVTSGSTGEPSEYYLDIKNEKSRNVAAFLLNKANMGINPFRKNNELMIKETPLNEIKDFRHLDNPRLFHRLKYLFVSEIFGIKSIDIKKENLEAIRNLMNRCRISGIYGYSSNLFYLAKFFKKYDMDVHLEYIILIAEGILNQQKKFISDVFHCPVFQDYGASECMRMGSECDQHKGYHMDLYNYYFEYLDNNDQPCKAGEEANIVVTNLNNQVFPLIRYKNGDRCIVSDEICSCGLDYPLVARITGRESDVIKISEDNEISISLIDGVFEHLYDFIIQYQIHIYQSEKRIIVKIIPSENYSSETVEMIKAKFSKVIDYSMDIQIEIVDFIPLETNGKTKSFLLH